MCPTGKSFRGEQERLGNPMAMSQKHEFLPAGRTEGLSQSSENCRGTAFFVGGSARGYIPKTAVGRAVWAAGTKAQRRRHPILLMTQRMLASDSVRSRTSSG